MVAKKKCISTQAINYVMMKSKYQNSESCGEVLTVILGGKSRDYEGYNSRVKDIFTKAKIVKIFSHLIILW